MRLPTFAENNKHYFAPSRGPAGRGRLDDLGASCPQRHLGARLPRRSAAFGFATLPTDRWVVLPAVLYTAVMVASIVVRLNGPGDIGLAMTPAMYLTIPLLIARCRVDAGSRLFRRLRACRADVRDPASADHDLAGLARA